MALPERACASDDLGEYFAELLFQLDPCPSNHALGRRGSHRYEHRSLRTSLTDMSGVAPDQRPTPEGLTATQHVRAICMNLPLVTERLSHAEAAWFINEKKNFVAMSDHHHDDRVSVTFAAAAGVQASLIEEDAERYYRPAYVAVRGWVGAYLDGREDWNEPRWERLGDLIVDAWLLVAPPKLHELLDPQE
jgi:hypothetical protein